MPKGTHRAEEEGLERLLLCVLLTRAHSLRLHLRTAQTFHWLDLTEPFSGIPFFQEPQLPPPKSPHSWPGAWKRPKASTFPYTQEAAGMLSAAVNKVPRS